LLDIDWIILPGSKHTSADLDWLCAQGLDQVICDHAQAGKQVLGICGGLQMLGTILRDPYGVDGSRNGLNLLPLGTVFEQDKTVKNTQTQFASVKGAWSFLSGLPVSGYEIHHGETSLLKPIKNEACATEIVPNIAWINSGGNVMGIYLHGMFENNVVMEALFQDASGSLEAVFEKLADHVVQHSDPGLLNSLISQA
jgi:adenosylcobyric acid synthase